jgi:integrase
MYADEINQRHFRWNGSPKLFHSIQDYRLHLEAAGRATGTIECYLKSLLSLATALGNTALKNISDVDVARAVIGLQRLKTVNNERLSDVTMNRTRSVYRAFFKWAFETGRIQSNPAKLLFRARASSMPTVPMTAEEVSRLLKTVRESNEPLALRDEALFATYAFTGIRRTEALALKVTDYDPVDLTIYIRQSKNGIKRVQPVPFCLARALNGLLKELNSSGCDQAATPIFSGRPSGLPLSARQAQNRFDKWKTPAGIRKDLTIHSFRAGFANRLFRTTGNIHLVARAMGHSDIRSTELYIEKDISVIREAVEDAFEVR